MPAVVKRLTAAGLVDVDYAAASLDEAAEFEPRHGVYTVSNTYHGTRTLLLDAHLDRLEDSARREGFAIRYDRQRLRQALRHMIEASGYGDARFRISAPGDRPSEMLLSIEPFQPPTPAVIRNGVRCITSAEVARLNPASKASEWMHIRRQLAAARPPDIYETFIVDADGHMLEGLSSNFYAIDDGELLTAGAQILAGISRTSGHGDLRFDHSAAAEGATARQHIAFQRSLPDQQQSRHYSRRRDRRHWHRRRIRRPNHGSAARGL